MKALLIKLSRGARPALAYGEANALLQNAQQFKDTGLGDWTGFYDWLRNPARKIIGVRYWPFENAQFILDSYTQTPNVQIDPRKGLLVFFGSQTEYRENISGDQDFAEARVLVNSIGEHALLLGCPDLVESDFVGLQTSTNI